MTCDHYTSTLFVLIHTVIILSIANALDEFFSKNCDWNQTRKSAPETFYINLETSHDRRIQLESHLDQVGLKYGRVKAQTPANNFIPDDVLNNFNTYDCKYETSMVIPSREQLPLSSALRQYTSIITGLCGGKHNIKSNHSLVSISYR